MLDDRRADSEDEDYPKHSLRLTLLVPNGPILRPGSIPRFQPLPPASLTINWQVEGMLDKSKGTLRLFRDALGDERVPSLSLRRLKDAYRAGRGSVRSWTTAGLFRRGAGCIDVGLWLI